jgi:signal transduction histidine kinase/CheY-like chemotaxis protein
LDIQQHLGLNPAEHIFLELSGLAFAGCAAAAICLRLGAWRRKNRELERLVRDRALGFGLCDATQEQLAANVGHEIRNPLNGVIGLAFALEQTELDPGQRHQLGMMRRCAEHLASLIGDMLDQSQVHARTTPIMAEAFDLQEVMDTVRAVTYEQSTVAGIPVDLSVDRSVPPVLVGDRYRIQQVLINYVGNALKYAGRGRVTLSARAVPMRPPKVEVTFTVADEGPGLSAIEQAGLFSGRMTDRGSQGQISGGAGVGLAVCRTLAKRMGGVTLVDGEVGSGARFILRLPLVEPAAEAAARGPSPVPYCFRTPALVVEDQEFNSAGMVAMLLELGINAEVARSGEEALRLIAETDYLLAFVDCGLAGMSGPDLVRAIRRMEGPATRLPIIATTASAAAKAADECRAAGMDGFIAKPITAPRLSACIVDCLSSFGKAPFALFAGPDAGLSAPYRLDTLRYMANDTPSEFKRKLSAYVRELNAYMDEIASSVDCGRFEAFQRTAHKIVGHLSIIQHARLIVIAQQIEEAAVNRSLAEARSRSLELMDGAREVSSALLGIAAITH